MASAAAGWIYGFAQLRQLGSGHAAQGFSPSLADIVSLGRQAKPCLVLAVDYCSSDGMLKRNLCNVVI